ncbi:alpha/beta fold hydrolase [Alicyclobacillus dauci]|uniref:Alpha/beta hydrolase n=1 Tax=Alicyclobacillus dauci TaxID=1475485 RepID=A0ABY6ZB78_9BACL|nr:alpha/beta hydrolase [Alicyclobacillus dauci]WAH39350.1 alpha/beta hydrolase [Alicyclobacillus dauci]
MKTELNGVSHYYEVRGNGPEAILFIHGLGGNSNFWYPQAQILARTFTVISYDLRGSGRAELGNEPYGMEVWVDDATALLDQLQIDKVHVVAHSMGTLIAQYFAVSHPDRTLSLTLVGPIIEIGAAGKEGLQARAKTVREQGMEAIADAICDGGLSASTKGSHPEIVALIRDMLMNQPAEGYARSCEALAAARAIEHHQVTVPVLLIAGDEDNTSPYAVARRLNQGFPNAQEITLAQCGHWLSLEKAGQVTSALHDFFCRI